MKIGYASDLHLEFQKKTFELPEADVLLLAGDICVISDLREAFCGTLCYDNAKEFFIDVSAKYKWVLWCFGNHEYYGSTLQEVKVTATKFFRELGLDNIIFGSVGCVMIEDVKFVFATLWTDINKRNPLSMMSNTMNDYFEIDVLGHDFMEGNKRLTPLDTTDIHDYHRKYLIERVQGHDKVVVMTHHAPSTLSDKSGLARSTSPYYYCTDMVDFVLDNPQISYYIHGHTHEDVDYMFGETRVMTNQRGYPQGFLSKGFEIKTFML